MNPDAEKSPGPVMRRAGFALHQPPVAALTDFRTPLADVFYVVHMGIMEVPRETWSLGIGGLIERPVTLTWETLAAMPRRTVIAAHECAGSPLAPEKPVRRVANVEWQGVALADVLGQAGVKPEARFLWSTGLDSGEFGGAPRGQYRKDLPLAKALAAGTLLATHINGQPLSPERGGPVRLVVPGYYGTNSTKWLCSLELRAERAQGYYTTTLYNDVIESGGMTVRRPVWGIAPHAIIVSHQADGSVLSGPQEIRGWAWALSGVALVEVSVDGGSTWSTAELGPRVDFSWQQFTLPWAPAPGTHRLVCRAVANDGAIQPAQGARNAWFSLQIIVESRKP